MTSKYVSQLREGCGIEPSEGTVPCHGGPRHSVAPGKWCVVKHRRSYISLATANGPELQNRHKIGKDFEFLLTNGEDFIRMISHIGTSS